MDQMINCWDMTTLTTSFPFQIVKEIIKIKIPPLGEPDGLLWSPSQSGNFSIRTTYRWTSQTHFQSNSDIQHGAWSNLWKSNLHPRHKHFLWKIIKGILPTASLIAKYVANIDHSCFICAEANETLKHLFIYCPSLWQCGLIQSGIFE